MAKYRKGYSFPDGKSADGGGVDYELRNIQDSVNNISYDQVSGAFDSDSFNVAGLVKPKLIGFSAYLSSDTAYNNNDTIVFDTELADTGSDYAIATGVFTTPVAGWYLFTAAARATVTVDTKRYGLSIVYDGGVVATVIQAASGTGAIGLSVVKPIHCDAAKDVHVTYNEDATGAVTVAGGLQYTYFTGHLIAKD